MTNAELAILSLIAEQPRHGYDIEQVIEQRGMRDWTEIGFSSIYYLLTKLEKNGFIESHSESAHGQGPARKVYNITSAGHAIWSTEALKTLSDPQPFQMGMQIGLASLPILPADEALAALRLYRQRLSEQHKYVLERWNVSGAKGTLHVDAMFELSLEIIEAGQRWVDAFIQKLEIQRSHDER